jgi:hypothetical protein
VNAVTALTQYRARFVVVNTVFLMLSVGAASIAFWPIYCDSAIIVLVVSATVSGSAIAILGARFRWSFLTIRSRYPVQRSSEFFPPSTDFVNLPSAWRSAGNNW